MATAIVQQLITLSNEQTVEVPEGADPEYFRRYAEAKLNPRPKRKSRTRRGTPSKSINYAEQVLHKRTAFWSIESAAGYTAEVDTDLNISYRDEVA